MITKELVEITENPLEGIKMFINDEDVTDIQAIIEGPGKFDFKVLHCIYFYSRYTV
jgi:ubiquitin-protein ligase